jgi:hypothetical protein
MDSFLCPIGTSIQYPMNEFLSTALSNEDVRWSRVRYGAFLKAEDASGMRSIHLYNLISEHLAERRIDTSKRFMKRSRITNYEQRILHYEHIPLHFELKCEWHFDIACFNVIFARKFIMSPAAEGYIVDHTSVFCDHIILVSSPSCRR